MLVHFMTGGDQWCPMAEKCGGEEEKNVKGKRALYPQHHKFWHFFLEKSFLDGKWTHQFPLILLDCDEFWISMGKSELKFIRINFTLVGAFWHSGAQWRNRDQRPAKWTVAPNGTIGPCRYLHYNFFRMNSIWPINVLVFQYLEGPTFGSLGVRRFPPPDLFSAIAPRNFFYQERSVRVSHMLSP